MDETDMSGIWDNWDESGQLGTIEVKIPRIGTIVAWQDKSYVILSTTTFQEDSGEPQQFLPKPTITTLCTILRITEEGDDAGESPIYVYSGDISLI